MLAVDSVSPPYQTDTAHVAAPKKTVVHEKKKKKKRFLALSAQLAVQYNRYRSMPEGLILSQTNAFRLPPPF